MSVEIPDREALLRLTSPVAYGDGKALRGGALHLSSVLPAVSDALGSPVGTRIHADPVVVRGALGMPQASSVIVVLVDGLGYWNIASRIGHAPYLRSLLADSVNQRPISTCTPSTTVAAMATFGTGTCPGLTGMTGYTQRNPDTGRLCQLIQFRDAPDPLDVQRMPTVFEALAQRGVRVTSVGLPKFANSPLTRAALRGSDYHGNLSPAGRIRLACEAAREPGLTYLYIRDTDKVGHNYGWNSDHWIGAFEGVDAQLHMLRRRAPRGTLIVITADHGMIETDPGQRIDVAEHPELARGVRMVGGEPRAPMLYTDDDADPDDVAQRWQEALGGLAQVRTRRQAIAEGLFGKVDDRIVPMLGDVIVHAAQRVTIVDSGTQSDKATRLPSVHGSLSMAEMDIPLIMDMA
ncbi:nucleotide pyrophosphatase/phosphodiesterase family protein [Bifidobacterium thermophilum]|uniref:alkaline phosphatase family protein n=1 Tax=Bifidobacterium thermophilum TaxID=33905 RepID=UPI0030B1EBB7